MIYQFIADAQAEYPLKRLCDTLGVSTSGYDAWRNRGESQHAREDGELKKAIEDARHRPAESVMEAHASKSNCKPRE